MKEIEILARALAKSGYARWEEASDRQKSFWIDNVKDVLRALRDNVSDGMLDAAENATGFRTTVEDGMRAMLSHLLEEE